MDNKKALEVVNALIEDHKRNEIKSALGEFLTALHNKHMAPLKKAIEDVQQELKKVDPTTKLPGVLDKQDNSVGMGDMQSNLNPGAGADMSNGIVKADPASTPSIMHASEDKKHNWKDWMGKCMKTLTSSQKPESGEFLSKPYVSDAQRKKFHAMENRGEISHAAVKEWDKASKGKKLPEHVAKANPDEKQDAKLGEDVEHLCENHMMENKDAERKEGHKIMAKADLNKKYVGFKAVEEHAKESGASDPAAVAAAVGRKKYGKKAFQQAAAAGHKMKKASPMGSVTVKDMSPKPANPSKPFGSVIMKDDVSALKHQKMQALFDKMRAMKTMKSESNPETQKEMSPDTKEAIMASAEKPIKIQPNRPGQANKPDKE